MAGVIGRDRSPDHRQVEIDEAIQHYYAARFDEQARLTTRSTAGKIELLRTRELIETRIDLAARVADIGGGTGVHATWLEIGRASCRERV